MTCCLCGRSEPDCEMLIERMLWNGMLTAYGVHRGCQQRVASAAVLPKRRDRNRQMRGAFTKSDLPLSELLRREA